MPKYDINTLQKEVFEYLINKKDELKKQGVGFAFDLIDPTPDNYTRILKGNYFITESVENEDGTTRTYFDICFYRNNEFKEILRNDYSFYFTLDDVGDLVVSFYIKSDSFFSKKLRVIIELDRTTIFYLSNNWKQNFKDFFELYPKIYELIQKELNFKNEIETSFTNNYKEIRKIREKRKHKSIHITKLSIRNSQGITSLIEDIPKNTNWIFLTGKNAFGKTSILQALAEKFTGTEYRKASFVWISDFIIYNGFDEDNYFSDYIVAYGPNRLLVTSQGAKKTDNVIQIFPEGYEIPLRNYELEFSRWFFKQDIAEEFKLKYKYVKDVMLQLIPNVVNIEVSTYDEVLYTEIDENGEVLSPLPLENLASGMKGIIAMVGDMILRLFETQPHINNPSELSGIVIIDELDLHLHPHLATEISGFINKSFSKSSIYSLYA